MGTSKLWKHSGPIGGAIFGLLGALGFIHQIAPDVRGFFLWLLEYDVVHWIIDSRLSLLCFAYYFYVDGV